jgi:hypothetical protein
MKNNNNNNNTIIATWQSWAIAIMATAKKADIFTAI